MARFEILDANVGPLGEGPAVGDMLFELGMMYSVGRDVPIDLVSAHKWFNLAAAKGNGEAVAAAARDRRADDGCGNRDRTACGSRLAAAQQA